MIHRIYQIDHEQFHRLEMVWERYGQQTSSSDSCPKDTGQVACCLMRQWHGWCNSIGVHKASICTLKRKGRSFIVFSFLCFMLNRFASIHRIFCETWYVKCTSFYLFAPMTHHNTISHEEHHPTKDMNCKKGYWQPAQVIILTTAKDILMTCNRGKSHKWQIIAHKMACIAFPHLNWQKFNITLHYSF